MEIKNIQNNENKPYMEIDIDKLAKVAKSYDLKAHGQLKLSEENFEHGGAQSCLKK